MYFNFRLWALTRGMRMRIAFAVLLGLLTAAAGIARLVLLGIILGRVLGAGDGVSDLTGWIIAAAGAVIARAILQYYKEMVAHRTAAAIQVRLRGQLYDRVSELGPAHFNQQRTGDAMLTMVDGVEQLETFFGQYLPQLFTAALTPVPGSPTSLRGCCLASTTISSSSCFGPESSYPTRDCLGESETENSSVTTKPLNCGEWRSARSCC